VIPNIERLVAPADRLREWAIEKALPLWGRQGFDDKHGRFEERLSLRGNRLPGVPQRLMVQARQIYCFSLASQRGWHEGSRELVERAYTSMVRDFYRRDGRDGWVFSINHDGEVLDGTRDLYSHAFVLLGVASYVKAGGSREALSMADETLAFLDQSLAASTGGYLDAHPRSDSLRRQNPHMHMLEGLLSLWSSSGERRYLTQAEKIFELFSGHFFQPLQGVLVEYFNEELQPAAGLIGKIVEPGHHYEWAWLLRWFERESGRLAEPYANALYRHADLYGYDGDGLVVDELLSGGQPHKRSRRTWPITEAIKANLSEVVLRRMDAIDKVIALTDRLHDRFLTRDPPGGWIDRLDENGRAATDFMPASTLYHILCALDELDGVTSGRTI
jgi:mannose/cellobiose epimerase-like protein (N-acyl-D-glucosamine 2-epimerase family)